MDWIKIFRKDLVFPPKQELEPDRFLMFFAACVKENHPEAFWRNAALGAHGDFGAQMWVSKQVTDDLLATHLVDADFDAVTWPAPSLEFVFEDPDIPGFLLRNSRGRLAENWVRKRISKYLPQVAGDIDEREDVITLITFDRDSTLCAVTHTVADFGEFAARRLTCEKTSMVGHAALSPTEVECERELALLAFKVLAFSSIPKFSPTRTNEPPTKKQGGKPGFLNRPKTDRLLVQYLPRHLTEKKAEADAVARKSRSFKGRLGHIRHFKSDFYVHKKGAWTFIAPVKGPDGKYPKRVFKVTK